LVISLRLSETLGNSLVEGKDIFTYHTIH